MSLPRPSADMPVASATASPPLEPDAVRAGFQGLRVRPCSELSVCMRSPISGRLVRPIAIAPGSHSLDDRRVNRRDRAGESRNTPGRREAGDVDVLLDREGNAVQRPERLTCGNLAVRFSRVASRLFCSAFTMALRPGLTASMRRRCASTTSVQEKSFRAIPPGRPRADRVQSSVMPSSLPRELLGSLPDRVQWRKRRAAFQHVEVTGNWSTGYSLRTAFAGFRCSVRMSSRFLNGTTVPGA